MMLGRSKWIQTMLGYHPHTTMEIQVPLSIFKECDVSFTYTDSMVSFILDNQNNPEYYLPEYQGKVFTFFEIRCIVETNGLPGYKLGNKSSKPPSQNIEAQIWNSEPLLEYKHMQWSAPAVGYVNKPF
jgi:hypothetical protein